ncbi:DNA-processing protein DprA [Desulfosporosinus youngiae]|uniref:DNA protecting protein DprA n=1 Tax=Desulfosporosinus youngiae DSM 17734 TaxID=768710 RepID=H5XZE2_9FIRM|nr:DNA-processing protein DprA [Desulfosporosinus youngiae]EHQ91848.1 DNA protecting protein DprA [Desulfosporosinus youngiae DSM 17734]
MVTYWLWLSHLKGIGPATLRKLVDGLGSPMEVYEATREDLLSVKGLRSGLIELILSQRSLEAAKQLEDYMQKFEIKLLTYDDSRFPCYVNKFPILPAILYYRGNLQKLTSCVGIVGSRRCTSYGKGVTADAAAFLAHAGITVVSGMAKGIDSYAHTACLKAGGYTIAFLANGVDFCYPPEHQTLMEEIIKRGAIVSPYPPGIRPRQEYFPDRNKLLAAWVEKLLVVEAAKRSGALITAEYAKKYKRKVFAVPNNIHSPESAGTNHLILNGAEIYLSPDQLINSNIMEINDSLTKVPIEVKKQKQIKSFPENLQEKMILNRLDQAQSINSLTDVCSGNLSSLIELLCKMELEGKVVVIGQMVKRVQ